MEEMIVPNSTSTACGIATACSNNKLPPSTALERKVRPQKDEAVNCPRCNSTNTKFCYYNNYSLTQPRYFCKTCRRYWTEGGSLRNIPVGGGSRKNKRSSSNSSSSSSNSSSSSSSSLASNKLSHDHLVATQSLLNSNPNTIHDLNLGFPPTASTAHQEFRTLSEFIQLPTIDSTPKTQMPPNTSETASAATTSSTTATHFSALELLNGLTSSRPGLTPFMPMPIPIPMPMPMSLPHHHPNAVYSSSSGFPLQDFKPTHLTFSLDSLGNGYGGAVQQQQETNNGRRLFPFQDLKQVSTSNTSADHDDSNANEQTREQGDSTGYWSGMLGTAGSW